MSEPFLSEIRMFGFNFPPRGWAGCDGQLLPISQNQALFALVGTTYGGNGQTTFALPDLRGRTPLHFGQGPGLQQRTLGQTGGSESETLSTAQLPSHTHPVVAAAAAQTGVPQGAQLAAAAAPIYRSAASATVPLAVDSVGTAGGGQPHPNMQPCLTINFSIALQGIFPSQN
jgi:microcystin-dependent protein